MDGWEGDLWWMWIWMMGDGGRRIYSLGVGRIG
jgi:hypothetical protein